MMLFTANISPGDTFHTFGSELSTFIPRSRNIATVISMCGADGSEGPIFLTVKPLSIRGAANRRAETN